VLRRPTSLLAAVPILFTLSACVPPAGGSQGYGAGPEPMERRFVNPGDLAALDGFTHAVRVGSTLYVSGEVALDSLGQVVGAGDLKAQARQAFANLSKVLSLVGALPADVVKLDLYVVNYKQADFAMIRQAGADYFPTRNPPAGNVLGIQSLPREGLLIAVDATVVLRGLAPDRLRMGEMRGR